MGIFSKFEGKMEDAFEGGGGGMGKAPISPVQIMKKAEKQMRREKILSAGKQYAPTLYTVLVNADDDQRLFGFYPTLAGECETRLSAAASDEGLFLDCPPLVRFIVDEGLKRGKFDVVAEAVSAPIIEQLRAEEMQRYGMPTAFSSPAHAAPQSAFGMGGAYGQQQAYGASLRPAHSNARHAAHQAGARAGAQAGAQAGGFAPSPAYPFFEQGAYPSTQGAYPSTQGAFPSQGAYPSTQGAGAAAVPAYAAQEAGSPLPYVSGEGADGSVGYGRHAAKSEGFADAHKPDSPSENPQGASSPNVPGLFFDEEPLPGQPPDAQPSGFRQSSSGGDARDDSPAPSGANQAQAQSAAHDRHGQPGHPQYHNVPSRPLGANPTPNAAAGVAAAGVAAASVAAGAAYGAGAAAGAHQGGQAGMPNTVAFVAGAGKANPASSQTKVQAHLTDVTSNRFYDLATNRVLIGRETGNDIVVNDLNASRQHAQIEINPQGAWVITDLGSTNGTLVNGQSVQRRILKNGDRVTLGVTEFVFSQD